MKKIAYIIALSLSIATPAAWAVPTTITYQGTLRDHGIPANRNSPYTMTFELRSSDDSKSYSNKITKSVTAINGLFSQSLDFQLASPYTWESITPYLKVTVEGQTLLPIEPVSATAYAFSAANGNPTGAIIAFAGQSAPTGWLLCDGSAVSRTQYAPLFAAIGTLWGSGDGSSTFNLPDLRGRSPVGAGQGVNLTNRTLGQTLGEENHKLSILELPSHAHGISDPGHGHGLIRGSSTGFATTLAEGQTFAAGSNAETFNFSAAVKSNTTGISVNNTGGDGAHNNMQPSAVVNFIIKT